jgi:hypothetical protein
VIRKNARPFRDGLGIRSFARHDDLFDNQANEKSAPNENYARTLWNAHTRWTRLRQQDVMDWRFSQAECQGTFLARRFRLQEIAR